MDPDRTFDWAIVDDGTEAEGPPVDERRRARNVRRLVVACVLGGVVILVLGVVGVGVVLNELDRTTSRERLTTSIHDRYQARYDDCVARAGRGAATCSAQITQQCANDSRWTPRDVDELSDVCSFGKP